MCSPDDRTQAEELRRFAAVCCKNNDAGAFVAHRQGSGGPNELQKRLNDKIGGPLDSLGKRPAQSAP